MELGSSDLAFFSDHVRANPSSPSDQQDYIMTDRNGCWNGTITFDSTHNMFSYSIGNLSVMLTSSGSKTIQSNAIDYVRTYNEAYILENTTLTYSHYAGDYIQGQLISPMNHDAAVASDDGPTILNTIPSKTVFYAWTHGDWDSTNGTIILDCSNVYYFTTSDVSSSVGSKTSVQPKYNFVFPDCCCSVAKTTYFITIWL